MCYEGDCVCKPGACSYHGVCYNTCDSDTGGTCGWTSCKSWRNAICVDGKCVCDSGTCSFKGKCESGSLAAAAIALGEGNATLMAALPQASVSEEDALTSMLPEIDDTMLLGFVAFIASLALAAALMFMVWRSMGRSATPIDDPLLDGAAYERIGE